MTDRVEDGGFAFPQSNPDLTKDFQGMTLRDWFAANERVDDDVVGLMLASELMGTPVPGGEMPVLERAKWWATAEARYKYLRADAMLAARKGGAA